jgi:predicted porin
MGGRARIGVAYDRHHDFTTFGKSDTGWAVKGGWNFGVVDLGAAFERNTYKTPGGDCKAKQYGLAAAVPVGTGAIRASWSKAKDLEGDCTIPVVPGVAQTAAIAPTGSVGTNSGAKQWNIGYEHRFSKRTNVGVGYAKIDNNAGGAFTWTGAAPNQTGGVNVPIAGSDVSTYFISITHRF